MTVTALKRRVAFATGVQTASRAVQILTTLAMTAVLIRSMPADEWGLIAFSLTVASLTYPVVDAGTGSLAVRRIAQDDPEVVLGASWRARLHTAASAFAVAACAAAVAVSVGHSRFGWAVLVGVGCGCVAVLADTVVPALQAQMRLPSVALVDILARATGCALTVLAAVADAGFMIILVSLFVPVLLDAAGMAFLNRQRALRVRTPAPARPFLRAAAPVGLLNLLGLVVARAGSLAVLGVLGSAAFGSYQVVSRVMDLMLVVPTLFLGVVVPVLTEAHVQDPERFGRLAASVKRTVVAVSVVLALVLVVLAPVVVRVLGGAEQAALVPAVRLVVLGGLFGMLSSYYSTLVIAAGVQRQALPATAVVLVVTIASCSIGARTHALSGAAAGTALTELIGLLLLRRIVHRHVLVLDQTLR